MYLKYFMNNRNRRNYLMQNILNSDFTYDSVYSANYPSMNIAHNDDETVIRLVVPGISREDILVQLKNLSLTVSVDTTSKANSTTNATRFSRTFTLNRSIADLNNIQSSLKEGILTITVPNKTLDSESSRIIEIL